MFLQRRRKKLKRRLVITGLCLAGVFLYAGSTSLYDSWEDYQYGPLVYERINITTDAVLVNNFLPDSPGFQLDLSSASTSGLVLHEAPFTAQAPFGEWHDSRQQDGCEEASVLMAIYGFKGKELTPTQAKKEILAMSGFQANKYGSSVDTSAQDTMERLVKDYFSHKNVYVKESITVEDIIRELQVGNLVIVPANGRLLGNPYFTSPGPERHMVLIRGYDPVKREFITNDPGTRRGELYRYNYEVLLTAIRDYPSGDHKPIISDTKAMIVIGP